MVLVGASSRWMRMGVSVGSGGREDGSEGMSKGSKGGIEGSEDRSVGVGPS